MSYPTLEGVPLATAAEFEALQREVADLRRRLAVLERPGLAPGMEQAMAELQSTYDSMSEEEKQSLAESEAEARAFFGRGSGNG